jgi:hypothetical protein
MGKLSVDVILNFPARSFMSIGGQLAQGMYTTMNIGIDFFVILESRQSLLVAWKLAPLSK